MNQLKHCIEKFSSAKVLCIGDVMLDQFWYGSVTRISPEAPVPIFKKESEKRMLGGAGNVVANLATLGCKTQFIGVVGLDGHGREVREFLENYDCDAHLLELEDFPTTVKIRLVAAHQHAIRVDEEETLCLNEAQQGQLLALAEAQMPEVDIVLLSDYGKGLFSKALIQGMIAMARRYGKKVIVDPKGQDYSLYAGAYLVKPNRSEFELATGLKLDPKQGDFLEKIRSGANALFSQFGIENLCVTLSEHGMIALSAGSADALQIPTEAREVFDVSGAGDTSLATLGAALAVGASMREAMVLGNIASGIVVAKLGTASVNCAELMTALQAKTNAQSLWMQKSKIVSTDEAKLLCQQLQSEGKKVGFTNGCFDLLHLGHLYSFMQARKECDFLVVAINSDASVQRLKGPSRPVHDEETRSLLLASLNFIDLVVIFSDDTAVPLVEKLRPDVIAKEGYAIENWPEAQYALSYGARAVQLQRLEGYSTSNLIQKLQQ